AARVRVDPHRLVLSAGGRRVDARAAVLLRGRSRDLRPRRDQAHRRRVPASIVGDAAARAPVAPRSPLLPPLPPPSPHLTPLYSYEEGNATGSRATDCGLAPERSIVVPTRRSARSGAGPGVHRPRSRLRQGRLPPRLRAARRHGLRIAKLTWTPRRSSFRASRNPPSIRRSRAIASARHRAALASRGRSRRRTAC